MFKRSLLATLPFLLMSAVAEGSTGGASADPATSGETPAAAEARKRAAASNFLPIVRGRLPLIFVHAVRFDKVLNAMANKDLCTKLATSVGKVFDIKKGRNFGYVTEGYKPTAEDVSAAEAWIAQVGAQNAKGQNAQGDKSLMQKILDEYKERGLATAEEASAQSAARTVTRKAAAAPATGTLPQAGTAETAQATSSSDAAALLS